MKETTRLILLNHIKKINIILMDELKAAKEYDQLLHICNMARGLEHAIANHEKLEGFNHE